jgi:SRSO17 transposase
MPEQWLTEGYKERWGKCNVPADTTFHTKPQLAAAMVQALTHAGLLPFRSVVADCLYGHRPDFLDAVEACVGVTALVALPAETHGWLQAPRTMAKTDL